MLTTVERAVLTGMLRAGESDAALVSQLVAMRLADWDEEAAEEDTQEVRAAEQTHPLAHPLLVIGFSKFDEMEEGKRFVAAYGQEFKTQKRPDDVELGEPQRCYANTLRLLMEREDVTYAEGFISQGASGLAILHSWAVDQHDHVIDCTLTKSEDWRYFGVRYDREAYLTHILRTGHHGVLGNTAKSAAKVILSGGRQLRALYSENQPRDERGRWTSSVTSAREAVVTFGKSTSRERAIVLDPSGKTVADVSGLGASIDAFPETYTSRLSDPDAKMTLIHNHPQGRSVSKGDIGELRHPGIASIEAVTHDGSVFSISRGARYNERRIGKDYDRAYAKARESLLQSRDAGELRQDDLEALVDHAVAERLARSGQIRYETSLSLDYHDLLQKHSRAYTQAIRALGGPGSGNFGHAGRPGEVGGSASSGDSGSQSQHLHFAPSAASFRTPSAEERSAMKIPPKWTGVKINPDKNGELRAVGLDQKGRTQYLYSAKHSQEAAAEKFERAKAFEKALPDLRAQVTQDLHSDDLTVRDTAAVIALIDKTGFRVGSDKDTLADKQAYGATTLQVRHAKVDGDKVVFNFTSKKGVPLHKTITDPQVAELIRERQQGKGPKDELFNVTDRDVRHYFQEHAPEFTPKDFRTRHATAMALELVKNTRPPKSEREFKVSRREIGKKVARFLGNTHTIALGSYIDPAVFRSWQKR